MAAFSSNIDITSGGTYAMDVTNGETSAKVATDLNGKFANIQELLQNGLPEVWTGDSLPDSLPNGKIILYNNGLYFNYNGKISTSKINILSTTKPPTNLFALEYVYDYSFPFDLPYLIFSYIYYENKDNYKYMLNTNEIKNTYIYFDNNNYISCGTPFKADNNTLRIWLRISSGVDISYIKNVIYYIT